MISDNVISLNKKQKIDAGNASSNFEKAFAPSKVQTKATNEIENSNIFDEQNSQDGRDWGIENDMLNNINIELPLPNLQNVVLSKQFDATQAVVVEGRILVILKRVRFVDSEKFIGGCSECYNINSDFLLFLESSGLFESTISSIIKCQHIKATISLLMDKMTKWKTFTTENQVQKFLLENYIEHTDSNNFIPETSTKFCGKLCVNEGIMLFEYKNNNWKCVICKYANSYMCRHGQTMNFPEKTDTGPYFDDSEPEKITTITKKIISKERFSGKLYFCYQ